MNSGRQITSDLYYLGASDRRLALFENVYPLTGGVAYNTYLVKDEQAILFDCVDKAVADQFFSSLEATLAGQPLAYVVIQHVEPDHSATVAELLRRHPETKVIASLQGARFLAQFFGPAFTGRIQTVAEKATLTTGRHTFTFYMAPMVHWPEVMVTYDAAAKVLFSADAFGTFGALSGNLFADAYDYKGAWLPEYRRYYANIVGKYGPQVLALLKKAAGLDIQLLCPLHGELDLNAQRAAIEPAPGGMRKVVLATNIAETSLTIDGVRVVIDAGLARVPRFDPGSGMTRLDTQRISRASASVSSTRSMGPARPASKRVTRWRTVLTSAVAREASSSR